MELNDEMIGNVRYRVKIDSQQIDIQNGDDQPIFLEEEFKVLSQMLPTRDNEVIHQSQNSQIL